MNKTYRDDQGTSKVRHHRPVKGEESHPQAGSVAKEAVDDDVVWGDPAHPVEPRQGSEDITGEPVPDEAGSGSEEEEALTGHVFLVLLGVRLVQGVKQRRVDEGARPDHPRGPYEDSPGQAGNAISHELRGEADHQLIAESEVLLVEDFLRQQEIGGVGTQFNRLGHDSDDGVLLGVEWSRVQGPDISEGIKLGGGKSPFEESADREGKQLDNDTGQENGGN